jgi:hypothetical protein
MAIGTDAYQVKERGGHASTLNLRVQNKGASKICAKGLCAVSIVVLYWPGHYYNDVMGGVCQCDRCRIEPVC